MDDSDKVISMLKNGSRLRSVAKAVGMSKTTVYRIAVEQWPDGITAMRHKMIADWVSDHPYATYRDAAIACRANPTTIRRACQSFGVDRKVDPRAYVLPAVSQLLDGVSPSEIANTMGIPVSRIESVKTNAIKSGVRIKKT
jgi:hypothetical protein